MGRRNQLVSYKIVTNGDMSSTITSAVAPIAGVDYVNVQGVYTGTPTGTFDFQASQDQTNWTSLTFTTGFSASGSASNFMADIQTAANYLRLVYTATSGSGTLNVLLTGRTVGA